jgi:hypothetical protein
MRETLRPLWPRRVYCIAEKGEGGVGKGECLADAAIGVEVFADVLLESGDDFVKDFLRTAQLVFERNDTCFERSGFFGGVGNLALLIEVPEESHWYASLSKGQWSVSTGQMTYDQRLTIDFHCFNAAVFL